MIRAGNDWTYSLTLDRGELRELCLCSDWLCNKFLELTVLTVMHCSELEFSSLQTFLQQKETSFLEILEKFFL